MIQQRPNNMHKRVGVTVLIVSFMLSLGAAGLDAQNKRRDYLDQAHEILERVPLFDGHNDAPWQYRNRVGYKFSERDFTATSQLSSGKHTDIKRLKEGKVGAQWKSGYIL